MIKSSSSTKCDTISAEPRVHVSALSVDLKTTTFGFLDRVIVEGGTVGTAVRAGGDVIPFATSKEIKSFRFLLENPGIPFSRAMFLSSTTLTLSKLASLVEGEAILDPNSTSEDKMTAIWIFLLRYS
jgi:hypothetical protein